MLLETAAGVIGTAVIGLIGWVFQLGTRVSVIESRREDLLVLIESKFDEVNRRLGRIENGMNGFLHDDEVRK